MQQGTWPVWRYLAIVSVVLVAGCNDGKIKTEGVGGTITLDGVPVVGATVNFTPVESGVGNPGYGITNADGKYRLQTLLGRADAGTTPGEYIVTVTKAEVTEGAEGVEPTTRELMPAKYTQPRTSDLRATVGSGSNEFYFDLKSN